MGEGAALLVDRLLPRCGYRQWVLSFAGPMAVRLGYDAARLSRVSRCFARAVMASLRRLGSWATHPWRVRSAADDSLRVELEPLEADTEIALE